MVARDLTGMTFGTLTVVGFDEERHRQDIIKKQNGECHTLPEWARIVGIDSHTLYHRMNSLNWTIEEALTLPPSYISQRK